MTCVASQTITKIYTQKPTIFSLCKDCQVEGGQKLQGLCEHAQTTSAEQRHAQCPKDNEADSSGHLFNLVVSCLITFLLFSSKKSEVPTTHPALLFKPGLPKQLAGTL